MSILLSHIAEDRALLAVDTAAGRYLDDHTSIENFEANKLLLVPHVGVGIAVSGNLDLLTQLYARSVYVGGDFDTLAQAVLHERFVDEAFDVTRQLAARDDVKIMAKQAGGIVGFSAKINRMAGVAFELLETGEFRVFEYGHLVSPPRNAMPDSQPAMINIAADLVAQFRDTVPGGVIGGRLVIADIRRDQMSVTSQDLPDAKRNDTAA